jgi:hypothetical protein
LIRRAEAQDAPVIARLGAKFHAYSPWSAVPYDAAAAEAFALHCITTGAVFLTEDGMCGGILVPLFFSPETKVAAELFWWAPTEGAALRKAFEAWALEAGASAVQFSALADGHSKAVGRLYRMAGFEPVETAYLKRF